MHFTETSGSHGRDDNIFDEEPLIVDNDYDDDMEQHEKPFGRNVNRSSNSRYSQGHHSHEHEGMDAEEDNEEELDSNIAQLRQIRLALTKVNDGLENVAHQVKYFNSNMSQTSQILDSWINIMSQTIHAYGFLSDPQWQGGKMDDLVVNEIKQQQLQKEQEEQERREIERLQREEEAARAAKAAAEAAKIPVHPGIPPRSGYSSIRGRGRGRGIAGTRPVGRDTSVTEYTVIKLFEPFGKISNLSFAFHKTGPKRGTFRGFCFVEFESIEAAENAIRSMDGRSLKGRRMAVAPSTESQSSSLGEARTKSKPYDRMTSHPSSGIDDKKPVTSTMSTKSKIGNIERKLREMRNGAKPS
ncbi:hypothetical protein H4219_000830 [Mycoemilia scoparia]|uniref:DASH complex subunit DUO1 n=1 Tax=Mycoemilia scoparia TaxID=417184 RepID=A0A9W8A1Z4_9FUNG|nr:hypothetical protein H4219_000830 [Mycoemilia scoparia]